MSIQHSDKDFRFLGFAKTIGMCHIRSVWDDEVEKSKFVVICSQYRNYAGTSVTNSVEVIASKYIDEVLTENLEVAENLRRLTRVSSTNVWEYLGNSDLIWIERYPIGTGLSEWREELRRVNFTSNGEPWWDVTLDIPELQKLTGYSADDLLVPHEALSRPMP